MKTFRAALFLTMLLVLFFGAGIPIQAGQSSTTETPTPTASPSKITPLPWPLPPATDKQLEEARACDSAGLADERYPATVGVDGLAAKFSPKTACDWAALAVAYWKRAGQDNPPADEGIAAFQKAIKLNSALAFKLVLLQGYFGTKGIVTAPPFAKSPIVRVEAQHAFSGLGTRVEYSYTISNGDTNKPLVSGKSGVDKIDKLSGTVDKALVQALGPALIDFVPMRTQFSQIVCYDDYPDWTVILTFKDGTKLTLVTNQSNVYFSGGPWQVEINKQNYTQYSNAFLVAMLDISDALKLPQDETAAMTCGGADDPLTLAFATAEPTESK